MALRELLDWIRPPEPPEGASPEALAKHRNALNRYRWNVSLSILVLYVCVAWVLTTFARAADLEKQVEAQVAKRLAPVQAEITAIKKSQAEQSDTLKVVSAQLSSKWRDDAASQIRVLVLKRCKESREVERESINREIERQQDVYKQYAGGERYTIRCDEL